MTKGEGKIFTVKISEFYDKSLRILVRVLEIFGLQREV